MERSECLKQAERLEEEGKIEEAISLLEECKNSYPEFLPGRLYLAKLLTKNNLQDRALEEVEYILSRSPNTLGALKLKGELLFSKGRLMEAKEVYLRINFLDPFDEEVSRRLQVINEELEKSIRQETVKEEVPFDLDKTPDMLASEEPFSQIEGGAEGAAESLPEEEVPESKETEGEPFETESMALVLLKQGEIEEAERIYENLSRKNPVYKDKLRTVRIIKRLHKLLEEFDVQGKTGGISG